jgi:hypothetical protein
LAAVEEKRIKAELERYERRLRLYQEVIKILSIIFRDATAKHDEILQFKTMTAEDDFIFGLGISQYIGEIYSTD